MKISQVKISTWRISRAILVVASLSSTGLTGHVLAAETQVKVQGIMDQINTNLGQQIAEDPSLDFKPVQLAKYAYTEDGEITLKQASSNNLGHLQELLKRKMSDRLERLNALQVAARNLESGDFVMLVAKEAYGAFSYVNGMVDTGLISNNAQMCAANTWLVKALTDYGIISQAYRLIAESKINKHDEIIEREDTRLKQELEANIKAREDERAAKSLDLDSKKEQNTAIKIKVEKLLSSENDKIRIASHESAIVQLNKDLNDIERQREELNTTIDTQIEELRRNYEQKIAELTREKAEDLGKLQEQLDNIFEDFGNSWGGKTLRRGWNWNRSMREEFKDLDIILSVEYTDLYSRAKSQILEELFSLVEDESPEFAKQKSLTLKALLGLDEENYQGILGSLIEREKQRNIELTGQANLKGNELATTIITEDSKEEPVPTEGSKKEPVPTVDESNLANDIASKFEVKKKVEIQEDETKNEEQSSESVIRDGGYRLLEKSKPIPIPNQRYKSKLRGYASVVDDSTPTLFDGTAGLPEQISNRKIESLKLLAKKPETRTQKKNHRRKNKRGDNRWG